MEIDKYSAVSYIMDNDVEFIRLQFCDMFGELKNMSIMTSQLERAFDYGIPFDASLLGGFPGMEDTDLLLCPDPSTLSVLPWRPQQGKVVRFLCDIKRPDGTIFEGDCRNILKKTLKAAEGYDFKFGPECEFYLFKTDENGEPTLEPHDKAGYFSVAPFDKGENVRRDICLTLKQMGLIVESSRHEAGCGQNEIDFKYDNAVSSADNIVTFKMAVKTIASRNGLYASFMPKPFDNMNGSGLHINIAPEKDGVNIFGGSELSKEAGHFMAGIMKHIRAISLFANPIVNSYKRLIANSSAKCDISWSYSNSAQLIRIPKNPGEYNRMELRSPDPACNPYIVFALLITAGLEGIKEKLPLPEEGALAGKLPSNLLEAVESAKEDSLISKILGEEIFEKYTAAKLSEWDSYQRTISKWEIDRYFHAI